MSRAVILRNAQIAADIYELSVQFEGTLPPVQPGQFAHVKLPGPTPMLLRRPLGINHVLAELDVLTLVYQLRGQGTRALSALEKGYFLDILAPLGRGFSLPDGAKTAAVVGGGIGAAPLRAVLEAWPQVPMDSFLGFRCGAASYQLSSFARASRELRLCTDDGSLGRQGYVTDLLAEAMEHNAYDVVFACGPTPMLKALQRLMRGRGIPVQVSLEERMGCGIGGCLVCNCKVKYGEDWRYRRVCADGPVFDLMEVELDG